MKLPLGFPLFVPLLALVLTAASASATIYSWEDENGVLTFTDDPKSPPKNAEVKVLSSNSAPQTVFSVPSEDAHVTPTVAAAVRPDEASPRPVTEGGFAVRLAAELGLSEEASPEEAASLLTGIRIAPALGRWQLDAPMTPELIVRLRALTVAATDMGWIGLTPEEALLAFDTAAALEGVAIPAAPDSGQGDSTYPAVDLPPLVYLAPPPPVFTSYYTWVPITDGFYWSNIWFGGFFVLTNFNGRPFHHHRFAFDNGFVRNRFTDRVLDHRGGNRIRQALPIPSNRFRNSGPVQFQRPAFSPKQSNAFLAPGRRRTPGSGTPGIRPGRAPQTLLRERPPFRSSPPAFSSKPFGRSEPPSIQGRPPFSSRPPNVFRRAQPSPGFQASGTEPSSGQSRPLRRR